MINALSEVKHACMLKSSQAVHRRRQRQCCSSGSHHGRVTPASGALPRCLSACSLACVTDPISAKLVSASSMQHIGAEQGSGLCCCVEPIYSRTTDLQARLSASNSFKNKAKRRRPRHQLQHTTKARLLNQTGVTVSSLWKVSTISVR